MTILLTYTSIALQSIKRNLRPIIARFGFQG